MRKFRPQAESKRSKLKRRLSSGYVNYDWVERRALGPVTFGYFFAHIHYLTSHAPKEIQHRYRSAKKIWWDKMRWWKSGASRKL